MSEQVESLSDADRMLELIGEVCGLLDLDEFRPGLLRGLRRMIAADWISLNDIGPEPEATAVLIEPEFPSESHAVFAEYAHQNPLLARYQRTRDGRAYRFSDVTTPGELRSTELYREFYAPIGLEHQIAFALPGEADRVLAVAMSRKSRDFSNAERDLLNRSRPFLIQAYDNAVDHTRLAAELDRRKHGLGLPLDDVALTKALRERGLTVRETEVLSSVSTGGSSEQAAEALGVNVRTIEKHLEHCFSKLGVHSRSEAVALAWSLAQPRAGAPR